MVKKKQTGKKLNGKDINQVFSIGYKVIIIMFMLKDIAYKPLYNLPFDFKPFSVSPLIACQAIVKYIFGEIKYKGNKVF